MLKRTKKGWKITILLKDSLDSKLLPGCRFYNNQPREDKVATIELVSFPWRRCWSCLLIVFDDAHPLSGKLDKLQIMYYSSGNLKNVIFNCIKDVSNAKDEPKIMLEWLISHVPWAHITFGQLNITLGRYFK